MKLNSVRIKTAGVRFLVPVVIVFSVALFGCQARVDAPGSLVMSEAEYEAWEIELVEMRILKNEEFKDPARSPFEGQRQAEFEFLDFYYPNRDLVFRTEFVASAGTDTVSLTKRKGNVVPYLQRGQVSFQWDGVVHTLAVFGPVDTAHGDYLWLPFYDETSGKSTYGGGRYLDVEVSTEGLVDLDFNYAYNPLCDYNAEKFNCTMPPAGNRVSFAVEAGEKSYTKDH
jgi:uncharacterized protein